jgi:serine/threonine protein kinase
MRGIQLVIDCAPRVIKGALDERISCAPGERLVRAEVSPVPDEPSPPEVAASSESGGLSTPVAIGPYRLVEELGRGGQGVVYLAEHESEHTKVALKILDGLSLQNEATLARFRREAFTAAAVEHPGICGIAEAGID